MIVDDAGKTYCTDWGRAGIMDFLMDFSILDLNKPYLQVPEKLYEYAREKSRIKVFDRSHKHNKTIGSRAKTNQPQRKWRNENEIQACHADN